MSERRPKLVDSEDLETVLYRHTTDSDRQAALTRIAVASWQHGWQAAVEEIAEAIALLAVRHAAK